MFKMNYHAHLSDCLPGANDVYITDPRSTLSLALVHLVGNFHLCPLLRYRPAECRKYDGSSAGRPLRHEPSRLRVRLWSRHYRSSLNRLKTRQGNRNIASPRKRNIEFLERISVDEKRRKIVPWIHEDCRLQTNGPGNDGQGFRL